MKKKSKFKIGANKDLMDADFKSKHYGGPWPLWFSCYQDNVFPDPKPPPFFYVLPKSAIPWLRKGAKMEKIKKNINKDIKKQIEWIQGNIATRHKWTKDDYEEFYFRDVTFLLDVIESMEKERKKNGKT